MGIFIRAGYSLFLFFILLLLLLLIFFARFTCSKYQKILLAIFSW